MKVLLIVMMIAPSLAGCGALVAGAAGGYVAGQVIEHNRTPNVVVVRP